MKIEDLKRNEHYIIVDNPRHPINPNGMVLEYIGETSNPVDGAFGFCTYDFKIVMIPYLEHDSWRFSIGGSYSIYESELNFLKKL